MKLKDLLIREAFRLDYSYQMHLDSEEQLQLFQVKTPGHLIAPDKPGRAFWTSTATKTSDGWLSAWLEYYKSTGFGDTQHAHVFKAPNSIRKLEIYSSDSLNSALNRYGTEIRGRKLLDWNEIAHEFDCVHVYGKALGEKHLMGWDVESTAWFNPKPLKLINTYEIK